MSSDIKLLDDSVVLEGNVSTTGSLSIDGESTGVIVDAGGAKRVGLMKYYGREGGVWRTSNQAFEIGRVNVTELPGKPTAFTTDLYVAGNGNVGIGTSTPATPLHVEGDVSIRGSLIISKDEISEGKRESWHTIIGQDNIKITHTWSRQGGAFGGELDLLKVNKEGNIGITGSLSVDKDMTCQDLRASNKVYGGGEVIIGDPDAMISEAIADQKYLCGFQPAGQIFAISITPLEISYWSTVYNILDWTGPDVSWRYHPRQRTPIENLKLVDTIKDLKERIAKLEEKVFES